MKRFALLIAALGLSAAACAAGGPPVSAPPSGSSVSVDKVLTSLAQRTIAGTAKVALTSTADLRGLPDAPAGPIRIEATGAFDYAAKRGESTESFTGGVSGTTGIPMLPTTPSTMLFDGNDVYVSLPPVLGRDGKTWAKATTLPDASLTPSPGDVDYLKDALGLAFLTGFGEPFSVAQLMKGLAVSATVVGHETVRGVATTRYRTTIDSSAIHPLPGQLSSPSGTVDNPFASGAVPADVWVDGQGRLSKMTVSYDLDDQGAKATGSLTFESYDYGAPVSIVVPSPSEVEDVASLLGP